MSNIIPFNKTIADTKNGTITFNANDEDADGYNPVTITTDIRPLLAYTNNPVNYTENGSYSITPPSGNYGIGRFDFNINVPQSLPIYSFSSPVTYTSNGDYYISTPTGYSGIESPIIQVRVPQQAPEGSAVEIVYVQDKAGSTVPLNRMSQAPQDQNVALSPYQVLLIINHVTESETNPLEFYRINWVFKPSSTAELVPAGAYWTRFSGSVSNMPRSITFFDLLDRPILSYGNLYDADSDEDFLASVGHATIYSTSNISFKFN